MPIKKKSKMKPKPKMKRLIESERVNERLRSSEIRMAYIVSKEILEEDKEKTYYTQEEFDSEREDLFL